MPTFHYETPNKGNSVPANGIHVGGSGFAPNQEITWDVLATGPTTAHISGSFFADPAGNLDLTITNAAIANYYGNPALPKMGGGNWSNGTLWVSSASLADQSITLTFEAV